MRVLRCLSLVLIAVIESCGDASGTAPAMSSVRGFFTSQPAQLRSLVPTALLQPLLTVGDSMPESPLTFPPAPSGLGLVEDGGSLSLFVAHDIGATGITSTSGGPTFQFSRVTRLFVDPTTGRVLAGALSEDGRNRFEHLAAGTAGAVLAPTGFLTMGFLTGEAAGNTPNDAVSMTIGISGLLTRQTVFGAITNAGMVVLPKSLLNAQLAIMFLDGTPGASEVYLYVRDTVGERLFLLRAAAPLPMSGSLHPALLAPGTAMSVRWVELIDRPDTLAPTGLRFARFQQVVDSAGALPFVRLSAMDLDRSSVDPVNLSPRSDRPPAIYFVDRGDPVVTGHVGGAINATCGGVCDPFGSLYRLDLDPTALTAPTQLVRIAASSGPASGWASPGAVATSFLTILIGEAPLHPAFNGARTASIWQAPLHPATLPSSFSRIAETTQGNLLTGGSASCNTTTSSCWDIGGILYTEFSLRAAKWIVSVRAHTLPFRARGSDYPREGGQLLQLNTTP